MKKEELISSVIMCIVSVLVLVGFTIAWFTAGGSTVVTGMQVVAGEMSAVKISTKSGGPDIDVADATFLERFASFGMPDYTNVESDVIGSTEEKDANGNVTSTVDVKAYELGPGTSGEITFYVTPVSGNIIFCDVLPVIAVTEDDIALADAKWYTTENIEECASEDLKKAFSIALTHIRFFRDITDAEGNAVREEITVTSDPTRLSWENVDIENKENVELPVTFYWQWDYENPDIDDYDEDDMFLGNHVSSMKFQFLFMPH